VETRSSKSWQCDLGLPDKEHDEEKHSKASSQPGTSNIHIIPDKGKKQSEPITQTEFYIDLIASGLVSVHQLSNETKFGYKNHFVPGPKFKFSSEKVVRGKYKKKLKYWPSSIHG
jgi:hypothetical protein